MNYQSVKYQGLTAFLALVIQCDGATAATGVCAGCHPRESAAYAASAMGRSMGTPVQSVPSGRVQHAESGTVIEITWASGHMMHHLTELGMRANYQVEYQIGAGKVGHSYVAKIGGYLLQSPASYYRQFGWDVSPGFKDSPSLDFDRVLGERCLFCHSNNPEFAGGRRLMSDMLIGAINCERCHGDTTQHLAHPAKTNVVNPARLEVRARDSVCEQCHLEGVARVVNPGKNLRSFSAGDELERTLSVYVDDGSGPGARAVSQVEQLALSRCARESRGKLWCGTCHNPHESKGEDRSRAINAVCSSCHAKSSLVSHKADASACVSCHMPRLRPSDVAHSASTDHRILARRAKSQNTASSSSIRAWHEPEAALRQRNLGLAYLEASAVPELRAFGDEGAQLLEELPATQQDGDPALLAALGDVELERRHAARAELYFRKAAALSPSRAAYLMYLGISLKQKGDLEDAKQSFEAAITLDASLQRAYLELSALYSGRGNATEAVRVLNRYLKWNPQSVLTRSMLESLR